MTTLGIIAGGGELPHAIAESARKDGRAIFVLAINSSTDNWVSDYQHEWIGLGETGKAMKALKTAGCTDVLLAGRIERPKFSELKIDAKGLLALPRVLSAAVKGDDALLRAMVDLFEREGFHVVGAAEAAPGLIATVGLLGKVTPNAENESDIALGFEIVRALGALDVGQAAAVCAGLPLAVEAAEGTDKMIARINTLPEHFRGTPARRRGVLVKAPKPIQDRKTDLPVIGVQTIENAAAAGLAGIALEVGGALIVGREAVAGAADRLGLFVIGVPR
jgi:hypothetical protein